MPERALGYVLLSLAMATVGTTVIASKLIAQNIPLFTATALRFAVALPILILLTAVRGAWLPRLRPRTWGLLALQSAAGSAGYTVLLISGLKFLPASDAGVVIGILPAVTALFAVAVLGERLELRTALAVACATFGVMAIAWYALVPTVGGFLLWYAGAARVPGSEAAVFTAVAPVTAVLLSVLLLGEELGTAQWLGLAAVAPAVLLLALPRGQGVRP